ncbi:MAG: bifunctional YncE family protein/alkaline phosphatase family protein [Bacteroidia bacterium]|nr:bifunctional YncE family protein/alkaline phosphatase family protein [Bacteroidia bacterium]
MHRLFSGLAWMSLMAALQAQQPVITLQTPARTAYNIIQEGGTSILPSGRYVTPAGTTVRITHDPFGLALSPDGKTAISLHDGVMTIIPTDTPSQALRLPGYGNPGPNPLGDGSFLGVAFSPDSKTAYLSGGDAGTVVVLDLKTRQPLRVIDLDGPVGGVWYEDSFTSDLVYNDARNELLVLDRGNFRLVRINLQFYTVSASVPVGRQPFGLALSPDRQTALIAHVGLFEYPAVPGVTPLNRDTLALDFPPYATFSKESMDGVMVEGRFIPGLGDPLAPEAMSVWTLDLNTNQVTGQLKTGRQIGEMIEDAEITGGASPNAIAVGRRYAYVTNATNDLISVIDYRKQQVVREIPIRTDARLDAYRGLMPFGLSLSADEKTLYVALLGFNAVAVIEVASGRTLGLIPTGWGPSRVVISPDGKWLYVTAARGLGAGPNGGAGFVIPPQGTYIGDIQLGTFQKIPVPDAAQLAAWTRQVLANTYTEVPVQDDPAHPLPPLPGLRQSPIRHVVYITKENRTYDEVLGQLQGGKGDSTLARFGVGVTVRNRDTVLTGADIMPNHHRVAQTFAYSDNFYCDSDASIHGHHWMMGVIPNEWVEANSSARGEQKLMSPAPGRRFPKATGAIDPEDYNEIGGLWEALERAGVSFYNFGEANEYAGVWEEWDHLSFGARQSIVFPMQAAVYDRTSRSYAGYNTNIPDQVRMDQFETAFTQMWLSGKDTMPQFIAIQIPNDHGAGPRPDAGYPYLHSYMADNDLAVGRILHFLSRTPYWDNMLVIITEDDPQGGVDHIDAHRSVLMMAGPYVKHGYVSHTHGNFGSLLKVIYNVLGVPYVNQYDVTATLLADFFTATPDLSPYTLVLPDKRVFDPQRALDVYRMTFHLPAILEGPKMDDEGEQRREHYRQQREE